MAADQVRLTLVVVAPVADKPPGALGFELSDLLKLLSSPQLMASMPITKNTPAKVAGKNRKRFILYLFLSIGVKITGPGVYRVVRFLSFTAPNACILFPIQPEFNGAETFTSFQAGLLFQVYPVPTASLNTLRHPCFKRLGFSYFNSTTPHVYSSIMRSVIYRLNGQKLVKNYFTLVLYF